MSKVKVLTNAEYNLFKDLVYNSCGILFSDSNRFRLDYKVTERMDYLGVDTPTDYFTQYLDSRSAEKDKEIKILLDVLTVNETFFFRNPSHFDTLTNHVLPELTSLKTENSTNSVYRNSLLSNSKPVKLQLWSAGCSTGQEPYSLAIEITEYFRKINRDLDLQIFATDISETAIAKAKTGVYEKKRLNNVNPAYFTKYFDDLGENIKVKDEIRNKVSLLYSNLKDPFFFRGMDIIFCRNVMIYFDREMQKHIVDNFNKSLKENGFLFIGHSESIQGMNDKLKFIKLGKGIVYRKIV